MKDMTMAKLIGLALKIALATMVAVLLGSETMNFAYFIVPADKWYLAYTIFGLTMGAFVVYLYLLLKDAETSLQKTVALIMTGVGLVGELATAGFGMQIEGWKKLGWTLTPADYDFMILAIRIIMLIHGLALMLYWFGDRIFEIIEEASGNDINKDGKIGKQNNRSTKPANAPRKPLPAPRQAGQGAPNGQNATYGMAQFLQTSGMKSESSFGDFLNETEGASMAWKVLRDGQSTQGYRLPQGITHRNFDELAGQVNGHKANP